jgi:hypothetical protein
MPCLAPAPLQLADPEREALHALINRHSTAQQIALTDILQQSHLNFMLRQEPG